MFALFRTFTRKMSKRALVFLAEGAEEMETVITVDVLRRAGINVTVGGLAGAEPVTCSRQVIIVPDVDLKSVENETFDAVIVPGGLKGAEACKNSAKVGEILKRHFESSKLVAAICAGPTAFIGHKIGFGKRVTSYPSLKDHFAEHYTHTGERVVQDGNLITSQGPGTTFEFALKIVEYLEGAEKMKSTMDPLLLKQ